VLTVRKRQIAGMPTMAGWTRITLFHSPLSPSRTDTGEVLVFDLT
jgi:hypothetical protein